MHRRSSHPPSCCCRSEEQGKSTGNKEAKKGKESTKDRQDTEQRRTARCDAPAVLTSRPPAAAARCASMEREAGLAGRQRQERQEQTRARDGQERKESKERKVNERKKTNEQAGGSSAAVRWRELTGDPPPSFPPLYSLATDLSLNRLYMTDRTRTIDTRVQLAARGRTVRCDIWPAAARGRTVRYDICDICDICDKCAIPYIP